MKTVRFFALLLSLLLLACSLPASAASEAELEELVADTAAYELSGLSFAHGDEWVILALVRGGCQVPEGAFERYYESVKDYVVENEGVFRLKTQYVRLTIALTAIGQDPRNVGGYDILTPILDTDAMTSFGMNGAIWALLGLDSGAYFAEEEAGIAAREAYVDLLLGRQLANGGFSLTGRGGADSPADTDITAMTLQALAPYRSREDVAEAIERGVECLSALQNEDGSFQTMNIVNCESAAQVIVALGELGIPLEDSRFVKSGVSPLDAMLVFRQADGSFLHVADKTGDGGMATYQGFYALVAALRNLRGESGLYHLAGENITLSLSEEAHGAVGLPGKHGDVQSLPIIREGVSFSDIRGMSCRTAVEALAARGIIDGMTDTEYVPGETMSRAQYAAIIVRALGLTPDAAGSERFKDVPAGSWFAPYVGTAYAYGIVDGRSEDSFDPSGTINRQEAAVMTARAAALCGWDTAMDATGVRRYLAEFGDYTSVSTWAREAMAFCFKSGILDADEFDLDILPKQAILRGEVALMVYRLLSASKLL